MNQHLKQPYEKIAPHKAALLEHPVYQDLNHLESLQTFMEHHVFAVWDFMSLLKAMQNQICGVAIPWRDPQNTLAARLINEIVLGEETDEDGEGGFTSHFNLYISAMNDCGANVSSINSFLKAVNDGWSIESALLMNPSIPNSVSQFVRHTFKIISQNNICAIAAAFTFAREDLLPAVFEGLVKQVNQQSDGKLDKFLFYLERHIELDQDQHGPMAEQLMISLCGDSTEKWQQAIVAAISSLQSRKFLWDGIQHQIQELSSV